jgi:hypothetical protein
LWLEHNERYDFAAYEDALSEMLTGGKAPQPVVRRKLFEAATMLASGGPKALDSFRDLQLKCLENARQFRHERPLPARNGAPVKGGIGG